MTEEELEKTEALVNQEIQAALPVETAVMDIEEAKKSGAMALLVKNMIRRYVWYLWEISLKSFAEVLM